MLKKKSLSQSMASMRELFPLHDYKKKTQKNFIKENIQKVKGCNGCLLEKKMLKMNNLQDKQKESNLNKPSSNAPSIKYNLKIIKRKSSPHKVSHDTSNKLHENEMNLINQSCQTDINQLDLDKISINCQSCGQILDRRNLAPQTSADIEPSSNKINTNELPNTKELPHKKKECPLKKSLDLSNYKMGEVPKYLKEKNAKLELEQKEKAEQERLAELRGLNDPKCPPGHMLMPRDELRNQIEKIQDEFDGLIRQLNMMPVSSDSYRVKQRKIQTERALKELEEKLELYKSGKVFVKISD